MSLKCPPTGSSTWTLSPWLVLGTFITCHLAGRRESLEAGLKAILVSGSGLRSLVPDPPVWQEPSPHIPGAMNSAMPSLHWWLTPRADKPFCLQVDSVKDFVTPKAKVTDRESWYRESGCCPDKPGCVPCRPLEWIFRRTREEFPATDWRSLRIL